MTREGGAKTQAAAFGLGLACVLIVVLWSACAPEGQDAAVEQGLDARQEWEFLEMSSTLDAPTVVSVYRVENARLYRLEYDDGLDCVWSIEKWSNEGSAIDCDWSNVE